MRYRSDTKNLRRKVRRGKLRKKNREDENRDRIKRKKKNLI